MLKAQPEKIKEKIGKLLEENKELLTQIKTLKTNELGKVADRLIQNAEQVSGTLLITAELDVPSDELRLIGMLSCNGRFCRERGGKHKRRTGQKKKFLHTVPPLLQTPTRGYTPI